MRLPRVNPLLADGAIAVALTILTQAEIGASRPAAHIALAITLPLTFRRRAPLAVALVVAAAAALQGLTANPPSEFGEYVAITLAVYTVAADAPIRPAVLGLAGVAVAIVLHDLRSDQYGSASGIASDLMTPVVFWGVGRAVRLALERARAARLDAETAVQDERRHIARELHDIVTHSLGIVVLQAQGARRVLDGREPTVAEALEAIEQSGRSALDEMRRLLGLLREDEERSGLSPQPRLVDVAELVDRFRAAGLAATLDVGGEARPLPSGLELSAYRVVQEALTNSLKHGDTAEVTIRYGERMLEVDVEDAGAANGHTNGVGGAGRGLLGMRERVTLYGGTLEHGPLPDGGFRVRARFPL